MFDDDEKRVWGSSTGFVIFVALINATAPWLILAMTPDRVGHVGPPPIGYVVFGGVIVVALSAMLITLLVGETRQAYVQVIVAMSYIVMFLGVFSYCYYTISLVNPASFGAHRLSRLDAFYFSVTVLTTTGFGDIAPKTEGARICTTIQMLSTVLVVGVLLERTLDRVGRGRGAKSAASS